MGNLPYYNLILLNWLIRKPKEYIHPKRYRLFLLPLELTVKPPNIFDIISNSMFIVIQILMVSGFIIYNSVLFSRLEISGKGRTHWPPWLIVRAVGDMRKFRKVWRIWDIRWNVVKFVVFKVQGTIIVLFKKMFNSFIPNLQITFVLLSWNFHLLIAKNWPVVVIF